MLSSVNKHRFYCKVPVGQTLAKVSAKLAGKRVEIGEDAGDDMGGINNGDYVCYIFLLSELSR